MALQKIKTDNVNLEVQKNAAPHASKTFQYPVAPSLKRAIVDVTARPVLAKIVDALGVTTVDRRSGAAMAQALLRAKRARAEDLIPFLDDETLRRACSVFQVRPEKERSRTIERLVETDVYRMSGSEIALHTTGPFVAMSAWCADPGRDSLCSLHAIRIENGKATAEIRELVRPPRRRVTGAAAAAGLDWNELKRAPKFATIWAKVKPILDDSAFLASHNGAFLRSVLASSCAEARMPPPPTSGSMHRSAGPKNVATSRGEPRGRDRTPPTRAGGGCARWVHPMRG